MVLPSAGGAFKNYKLGAGVDSGLELFAFGIQILYSTLARFFCYWTIGIWIPIILVLCKPCKLIFLAKEMAKPQLCYQINKNIFGCAERLRTRV